MWNGVYNSYSRPHIRRLRRWETINISPEEFVSLVKAKNWCPSTAASYYAAYLKNVSRRRQLTQPEKHLARTLEGAKNATYCGNREEMTRTMAKAIWRDRRNEDTPDSNARAAIVYAWTYGQRISDALLLDHRYVTEQRLAGTKFYVMTLLAGKTIRCTGPVCNHIPRRHKLGRWLRHVRRTRRTGPVFTTNPSAIKKILLEVGLTDRRSIRRGGLQDLARRGVPLETIRRICSRHTTEKSLNTYLAHGAMAAQDATTQLQLIASRF